MQAGSGSAIPIRVGGWCMLISVYIGLQQVMPNTTGENHPLYECLHVNLSSCVGTEWNEIESPN